MFSGLFSICWIRSRILSILTAMLFRFWIASGGKILVLNACLAIASCVALSCCSMAFALCTSCWNRSVPLPPNTSTAGDCQLTAGAISGDSTRPISAISSWTDMVAWLMESLAPWKALASMGESMAPCRSSMAESPRFTESMTWYRMPVKLSCSSIAVLMLPMPSPASLSFVRPALHFLFLLPVVLDLHLDRSHHKGFFIRIQGKEDGRQDVKL